MKRALLVNGIFLATFAIAACDKAPEAPATETPEAPEAPEAPETPEAEAPSPEAEAAEKKWADMDFDERKKFMSKTYYPAMKEKFQAYDAKQFANFTCDTCHGENAKEVNFKMPNGNTPLDAADPVANGKDMDEEMTKFMLEEVIPAGIEMLGEEDSKCLTCHEEA